MSSFNAKKILLGFYLGSASLCSLASPWLEAKDPFLRSSLLLLSDSGQLTSPVSHFPMRWSMFGDDLTYTDQDYDGVLLANQELLYTLNTAKLNRGNRMFRVLHGANPALPLGFGQFNEDEKGVYAGYEYLGSSFSYRLTAGYSEYQGDTRLNIEDSYLAFSSGAWLWSIGNMDRWWGQGWQHNLILASYAKAAPDIAVSYLGESDLLGVWSVESLIAKPEKSSYDYQSATRFVSKPFSLFEYGVTYQRWFSDIDSNGYDEQLAFDGKLTLPNVASLYHSVYAEAASSADITELGAWLLGWTGSFPIGQNTGRIVLETQQSTSAHDDILWIANRYPSTTDGVANTSYLLDSSDSIAFYLQLANDHQLGLSLQRDKQDDKNTTTSQLTYNLPALAGMVRLGVSYQNVKNSDNQSNVWVDYEFRF